MCAAGLRTRRALLQCGVTHATPAPPLLARLVALLAGTAFAQPRPGDVFREYPWTGPWVNAANWQRVTDPAARHKGAKRFLPNPVNRIAIDDLDAAVRVEACLEQWGGHARGRHRHQRPEGPPRPKGTGPCGGCAAAEGR